MPHLAMAMVMAMVFMMQWRVQNIKTIPFVISESARDDILPYVQSQSNKPSFNMILEMGKRRKSARRTWKKAFMRDTSVRFPLQRFTDRRIREKQSLLVGTVSLYGQTYFACRALRYSFPSIPHPVTIPFPTVFMFVLCFHLCSTRKNNKLKKSRYAH